MKNNRGYNIISPILLIIAMAVFLAFSVDLTGETLRKPAFFFTLAAIAIVMFVFRKSLPREAVIWTIAGGTLVKVAYILYTAVWTRQHDVISFGAGEGHAAYIEYLLAFRKLPDFDPRMIWGFFQPPLHHIISAIWMWFGYKLHIEQRQIEESVQVLTLSYMCILVVTVYFICMELGMKKRGMLITMLIVSFHPIFILLSGSINNDALATCLMTIAVYITIRWYKEPGFILAALLALCIGLAMMAKLSAGLVAPGIGCVMLYRVWNDRKTSLVRDIFQLFIFGIIVFPIGLWWPIRNKILWDMPVNYIPEVGEQLTKSDLFSRLLDVRTNSVYASLVNNGDSFDEYNVFLAMIKTALFGEGKFSDVSRWITPFAVIAFVTFVVIILLEVVAFIRIMFEREAAPAVEFKILLGVISVTIFAGYLSFALGYNNFSAQDFRYAALMVATMAVILGLWDDRLDAVSKSKSCSEASRKRIDIIRKLTYVIAAVFAASSATVYLLIGIF